PGFGVAWLDVRLLHASEVFVVADGRAGLAGPAGGVEAGEDGGVAAVAVDAADGERPAGVHVGLVDVAVAGDAALAFRSRLFLRLPDGGRGRHARGELGPLAL